MSIEIALDLRTARKKSGLQQSDCAHLLNVSQPKLSRFESGDNAISLRELCILSLVYNRPLQNLCQGMFAEVAKVLPERVATLPDDNRNWIAKFNRNRTLTRLSATLRNLEQAGHGSA